MDGVLMFKGQRIAIPEHVDIRILTEVEYDSLSEEQIVSGVFYIPDGTGKRPSLSGNTYSLEEIIVGTWVDGRPIYRKVYYFNQTTDPMDIDTRGVVDILIKHFIIQSRSVFGQTNVYNSNVYRTDDGNLILEYPSGSPFVGSEVYIIVEYTKKNEVV